MEITVNATWDYTSFYIAGILHFDLPRDLIFSTQAWQETTNGFTKFVIAFTNAGTGRTFQKVEYDSIEKWKTVLSLWDTAKNKKFKSDSKQ